MNNLKEKLNDTKEKINKLFTRKILFIITLCLFAFLCGVFGYSTSQTNKIKELKKEIEESIKVSTSKSKTMEEDIARLNDELLKINQEKVELQASVDIASEYLELNVQEKELVDSRIKEVKQATADELKRQKEEEERAKKEAEEKAKAEAEAKKKEEEEAKRQAEAQKYETGLTWEQIAREERKGEFGKFEGKILQVMKGDGYTQYRIAINSDYDTIMLLEVLDGIAKETLLEDDYVYFKGYSLGTHTYTTVMGAKVTIPAFEADEILR